MSLTRCPDCGHEVSTTAASCPNCGYTLDAGRAEAAAPVREERVVVEKRGGGIAWFLLGLVVLTLLVVALLWYFGVIRFV